jgi:ribonuclease I
MCERQRLPQHFVVHGLQPHSRASGASPRAALRCERGRMLRDELALVVGRQLDHAAPVIGTERREYPAVHAEVRMSHVRAFNDATHPERNPPEVVSRHSAFTPD